MNSDSALRANFIGTLVRRQFKPGQPYVQLVFESSGRVLLALSRNVALVQSLKLGVRYRVSGAERTIGGKQYVLEPQLVPSPAPARTSRRARYAAFAAGGVLLLASGGMVAGLSLQANDSPKASSTTWHAGTTAEKSTTVTVESEKTTPAPSSAPTDTAPAAAPTPTSKPKPTSTSQSLGSPSSQQPSTPTAPTAIAPPVVPAEDCELVTVPFGSVTVTDDTRPEGIATAGQNGQNKVCYPNGRGAAPVTTTIVLPVDEVTIVHTPPTT